MNIVWAIKLLLPVVAVCVVVMYLTRKVSSGWISEADWKTTLLGLIGAATVAFLSFSTLIFALGCVCLALWLAHRYGTDRGGRLAAYALLMASMPPAELQLENIGGIGYVTSLNPIRLLSLTLLLPALLNRPPQETARPIPGWLRLCDLGIFGYLTLMAALAWSSTATVLARHCIELVLDILVPYLALTRCAQSTPDRLRMLAVFVLAMCCQATIAVIESVSHHQFYNQLQHLMGTSWQLTWGEFRSGFLRGQAAPQGPLILATMLLVAMGAAASLPGQHRARTGWLVYTLLLAGLWATFGRAAWLCAAALCVSLLVLPRIGGRLYIGAVALLSGIVTVGWTSGIGQQLTEGVIDLFNAEGRESFNILYRQELLEASVALLKQSPWLGVGDFLTPLAYLKQGEGIIDLVNTYLVVALNVGLIGLGLLMTPFLVGLWRQSALVPRGTPALGHEALAWIAMTVALMALVFTVSPIRQVMQMLIWAAALAIAHLASLERPRR